MEAATGVVLLPNGDRLLGTAPYYAVFRSFHDAEGYAPERVEMNLLWECSVRDSNGAHSVFVRAS